MNPLPDGGVRKVGDVGGDAAYLQGASPEGCGSEAGSRPDGHGTEGQHDLKNEVSWIRFRDIYEKSPVAYQSLDAEGHILDVNPAWEKLTGYTKEEVLGYGPEVFLTEESKIQFDAGFPNFLERGTVNGHEFAVRCKDGAILDVLFDGVFVYDRIGRPLYTHCVLHDVTELKKSGSEQTRLQAQLACAQRMETVGRLAGGIAHEFNNMLEIILGFTELSMNALATGDSLFSHLEEVKRAALRSADLTQRLLSIANRQPIIPRILNINQVIHQLIPKLRQYTGEEINLIWIPVDEPWSVLIDPAQIEQMLTNLCINSREAIAERGTIVIETGRFSKDGDVDKRLRGIARGEYTYLMVRDDGVGMDRQTMDVIFEPFFTTRNPNQSSGLGLSVVHGIVRQNHGFVRVDSEVGKGSEFFIYLPRHEKPRAAPVCRVHIAAHTYGHETVLLAEDEPAILDIVTSMLQRLGFKVLAADSGESALRIAAEYDGDIHLLLTDVVMPKINGRDLAEQLQALYPAMKILFMSGYTADIIAWGEESNDGGHFIQKPFLVADMASKIREVLGAAQHNISSGS